MCIRCVPYFSRLKQHQQRDKRSCWVPLSLQHPNPEPSPLGQQDGTVTGRGIKIHQVSSICSSPPTHIPLPSWSCAMQNEVVLKCRWNVETALQRTAYLCQSWGVCRADLVFCLHVRLAPFDQPYLKNEKNSEHLQTFWYYLKVTPSQDIYFWNGLTVMALCGSLCCF